MKNKIPLFIVVFVISLIMAIYNFDVLSSFVTGWPSGKHYFGKFIFVTLVLITLFSLAVTFIIDWIIKVVFQRKGGS
jgi:hypothetical protein